MRLRVLLLVRFWHIGQGRIRSRSVGEHFATPEETMAISGRIRETYILGIITLVSCVGSVGLTLALTSLPIIQSTAAGNAGQAYDAAAAATSVIVLVYIARTFRHQGDEARMNRELISLQRDDNQGQHKTVQRSAEAAVRARHIKLLEMAINDPELMQCWPMHEVADSDKCRKQYLYCNLIISHHCMCYVLGYSTDDDVEQTLYHTFGNEIVRNFWGATRPARTRTAWHGGQMRKFYDLAELAYLRRLNDDGVTR